ncbi:hypothetical protein GH714_008930 [Hevea brasiliensis]|uniref:Fanconi-associated nuclease n=1 Tax=Hevea brasiliensis TaxID=3981 RepID=A0A6A6NG76_HEVBR|nr:hypothetical protein GH714_008930 [Hevea brasiliensis]
MTQRTLLELNFCSQTSSPVQNAVINSENSVAVEENDSNLCKLLWTTKSVPVKNGMASSTGKATNGDRINLAVGPSSLPLKDGVSTCDTMTTVDDISGVILKTSIVGRRFSIVKDLNQGAKISLLRDPDNAKDPNAIKGYSDVKAFTSLWKNVLHAVESAKNCASSATKYQQNFCLLMQEVLRSNHHIFTDDEKNFMESFTSLSDDSQRLFVRLYTRKGPWFRVSSILYPEVSDSEQAINDLSAIGYICSFADPKELQNHDMKEILNLLTISKLREITYLLKKNSSPGTRKQDLIATLLSTYKDKKVAIEVAQIMDESLEENNNELVLRCIEIATPCTNSLVTVPKGTLDSSAKCTNFLVQHMGCSNETFQLLKMDYWIHGYVLVQEWHAKASSSPRKPPRRGKLLVLWVLSGGGSGGFIFWGDLNCEIGKKSRFYGENGEQCGVEQLALQYYAGEGGTACLGVNWGGHSLSELRAVVTCIGGPCLASLCRHLAQDYRSWSSGMPDLLLWRFHGEYRGEAKLVEVKGPKDRLSEQQQAWLLLLMDCGFDTEVCKVKPRPSVS